MMNHGSDRTNDADMTAALVTQGNNGDRHSLEAIMNTDDADLDDHPQLTTTGVAGKGSLAFILGGAEETETSGPTFANLTVSPRVVRGTSSTENMAANTATPLVPRAAVKKSRICKFDNCTRYVVNRGLCIGHGGGKRCAVVGCTSSAKNLGVCWKHGGSTKCTVAGCENRAKSRGVCWSHGGGRKCNEDACTKTAVSHGLCWAHGGGKRCVVEGCRKPAYERNGNVCSLHQAEGDATQR